MDVLEKFSTHCRRALRDAFTISKICGQAVVEPAHVLCAIAKQRGSIGAELLFKANLTAEAFVPIIGSTVAAKHIPANPPLPRLSETSCSGIERATRLSFQCGHHYVGTEHLLAGMLEQPDDRVNRWLKTAGVTRQQLHDRLQLALKSTSKFPELADALESSRPFGDALNAAAVRLADNRPNRSALSIYTTELTDANVQQRIDPLIGRAAEVDRVIEILCRRTKNNPLLLGDPGVGKTAIVEGLAKKILRGEVPDALRGRRLYQLDLGLLVAGSSYRGEFEQRFKQLLAEVKQRPEAIVFIDELHTIAGAGAAGGALDAANLMKPSLARGEIRCIGATTLEDYKRHLEHDAAFERRFQPIVVRQPDVAQTMQILRGVRANYERFHNVTITDQAIVGAATLADRYVTNKFLPDKAIDVLDETAAHKKINRAVSPGQRRLRRLERAISALREQKRQAVVAERYAEAQEKRQAEQQLSRKFFTLQRQENKKPRERADVVTLRDVQLVVSKMIGVNLEVLQADVRRQIAQLERTLARRVLGQAHAIAKVAEIIRRAKAGIANIHRPLGSFLFLGPSGVGKTELAKVLADTLFGGPDGLIRLDMSEFVEGFNVSRLIGSPAGYVGYRESAQLTDQVRKSPHSVVLFDEIEKAHPQVLTLLLQILEDGQLTDATGKLTTFRQTVIVMTSNFGSEHFRDQIRLGFAAGETLEDERVAEVERELLAKLTDQFPLELINRIDQTVIFRPLEAATIARIADLQLRELAARIGELGSQLRWTPAVSRAIAKLSFAPDLGARAVRRTIQQHVETPVAERLLQSKRPTAITIGVTQGKLTIS